MIILNPFVCVRVHVCASRRDSDSVKAIFRESISNCWKRMMPDKHFFYWIIQFTNASRQTEGTWLGYKYDNHNQNPDEKCIVNHERGGRKVLPNELSCFSRSSRLDIKLFSFVTKSHSGKKGEGWIALCTLQDLLLMCVWKILKHCDQRADWQLKVNQGSRWGKSTWVANLPVS